MHIRGPDIGEEPDEQEGQIILLSFFAAFGAVGDYEEGFGFYFVVEVVDCVFNAAGWSLVVAGCDEDVPVVFGDLGGPGFAVFVREFCSRWSVLLHKNSPRGRVCSGRSAYEQRTVQKQGLLLHRRREA